jgi:gamma-glutamylcyclotransferase (GGCT)/AIG2-like uncharacterized protein YtfP
MMNKLLFVYGTLLIADNEFAVYLKNNSSVLSSGKFKGKMYDIGTYPGVIPDPENKRVVSGSVCQLNDPQEVFKILDDYEGFGGNQQQPYLFVRELLSIETPDGPVSCWIYLYNLSVDGLFEITSGDYLTYLAQQKKR